MLKYYIIIKATIIMKSLLLIFITILSLQANIYYSKVEPYETRKISSNVLGVVTIANENLLGQTLNGSSFVVIDSQLDREELGFVIKKVKYLKNTLAVNQKILLNLKAALEKKRANYERVKNLKIKSSVEKDREFYDLVSSENAALTTQKEINSLKNQITDLSLRKAQLECSIEDKNLKAKGFKLYSLEVKVGEVVNKGTPLATLADESRGILTIYLNEEDLVNAKKKFIYIDGKKTPYSIDRLLNIADSKNISKYKAQIIVKAPKIFSKLVKIELRDE